MLIWVLNNVEWFRIDTKNPETEKAIAKEIEENKSEFSWRSRNKNQE